MLWPISNPPRACSHFEAQFTVGSRLQTAPRKETGFTVGLCSATFLFLIGLSKESVCSVFHLMPPLACLPAGVIAMARGGPTPKWNKEKKVKTDAETIKRDRAAKAAANAAKDELRLKLTAVARRWGRADLVFRSPGTLWQIQVEHFGCDGRLGQASFKKSLIGTLQDALHYHPYREVCDLKSLLTVAKVKVLNGAPGPVEGSSDPDNLGMKHWEPVLYAAGDTPYEALTVVRLVMEQKVRAQLLHKLPDLQLVWALRAGEAPPQEAPPRNWTVMHNDVSTLTLRCCPFKVLPPLGRRHILAHMQLKGGPKKTYILSFSGGIYHHRKELDEARIPGRKANNLRTGKPDFIRLLYNLDGGDASKAKVSDVLNGALGRIPVLLTHDIPGANDTFLQWLLHQSNVVAWTDSASSSSTSACSLTTAEPP